VSGVGWWWMIPDFTYRWDGMDQLSVYERKEERNGMADLMGRICSAA